MDKETKIELLKIFGMIVILVLLIIGIVWMNKEETNSNVEDETSSIESLEEINDDNAENEEVNNENEDNQESSEEQTQGEQSQETSEQENPQNAEGN